MISAVETAGSEHLGRDLRAGQPQQRSRDTSARERDDDLRIAQARLRSPIAPRAIRTLCDSNRNSMFKHCSILKRFHAFSSAIAEALASAPIPIPGVIRAWLSLVGPPMRGGWRCVQTTQCHAIAVLVIYMPCRMSEMRNKV